MDDVVAVQVGQGESNVVGQVDLEVVGEGGCGSFQEPREALLHQLHQEDGSANWTMQGCFIPCRMTHSWWK